MLSLHKKSKEMSYNYIIIINNIIDLCNISHQYHMYKNHFHYYKNNKNLITDFDNNKEEIICKMFPLFINKLNEIIQHFKHLDKKIIIHSSNIHCIFTDFITNNHSPIIINANIVIQFYANENYIKLLFNDIFQHLYNLKTNIVMITRID